MTISFARHQFPPAIIRHAVRLYMRFTLSYRDVENLLAERGLDVSYETVRRWVLKFGPLFARELRRRRPRPTSRWHLDEMAVIIGGSQFWLWRVVDDEGEALDLLVQRRRDTAAAVKLMRKLLKQQDFAPEARPPFHCERETAFTAPNRPSPSMVGATLHVGHGLALRAHFLGCETCDGADFGLSSGDSSVAARLVGRRRGSPLTRAALWLSSGFGALFEGDRRDASWPGSHENRVHTSVRSFVFSPRTKKFFSARRSLRKLGCAQAHCK